MTNDQVDAILDIHAAFKAYGYEVVSEPIPGEEDLYYATLREGIDRISDKADWLRESCGYRGRSKRLLDHLHYCLAEPTWGVQVR